ncbi:MAG: Fic family protein [bacterium]|nr:Fic family protein [bacterium]
MDPSGTYKTITTVGEQVRALEYGLEKLRTGFPLSNRLLRDMHQLLLSGARGEHKAPGEFRRTQNWIGGGRPGNAHFVPPPPELVEDCMGDLEKFLHFDDRRIGIIEKAALAHVQFETIHPFLDGNGRLGRLLIALLLYHDKILQDPALYVSLYFKTHRTEYYSLLDRVRTHGDWDTWIRFFAEALGSVAAQATDTARKIDDLARTDRARVAGLGRKSGSALPVIEALLQRPLIQIAEITKATGLTPNTVAAALKSLTELNITSEISGRQRDRIFAYDQLMNIINEGMESTN